MVHAALAMAGPAGMSCAAARPGWLAGQKLPPVAWLIATSMKVPELERNLAPSPAANPQGSATS
jgi:hypothetical protein